MPFIHPLDSNLLRTYYVPKTPEMLGMEQGASHVRSQVDSPPFPCRVFGDIGNLHKLYVSLVAALTTGSQLASNNGSTRGARGPREGEAGKGLFFCRLPLLLPFHQVVPPAVKWNHHLHPWSLQAQVLFSS